MTVSIPVDQVDYSTLDSAKNRFIEAARSTSEFASKYGTVLDKNLGASANIFSLDLSKFESKNLHLSLIPEGLGTADDAHPEDMTESEALIFWNNIAYKVLSCLTNDAASAGLQSVAIGLYLPSSTPERVFTSQFLSGFLDGIIAGCKEVGCIYLSGETPQLKTKMVEGKLDLAGAVVAIVPPGFEPVTGSKLQAGDYIVMVESSGPHENGFTPLRKLAAELPDGFRTKLPSGQELWKAMNAPSKLYTPLIQKIIESGLTLTNIEHITGHGWQKLMRSSKSLRYKISTMLPVPEVFLFAQEKLGISAKEMLEIFNYGSGLALFIRQREEADKLVALASELNLAAVVAGQVEESSQREVIVEPLGVHLSGEKFELSKG
jgi:phosphoribosylformylglycinamidine cyclo-ligase